jgi:EAL domain-containing protein (putative c-di-GMP-specific phosphodiesterase class I)
MIPADELVRLAEDSGLIIAISEYVTRLAMHDLISWGAETGRDDLYMSVNISAVHLREERLAPMLDRLTAASGLHPHRLTLELTESAAMRAGSAAHATLADLKARGYSLAIDDFGTGYSSLGQLERLPVDILKIDQTFVSGIGQTGRSGAIARAIIALGRSLGLRLVAEGVETEAQLAFLREQRCDVAQGYLLGEPVSSADILTMLRDAGDGALRARPPRPGTRGHLAIAPRA